VRVFAENYICILSQQIRVYLIWSLHTHAPPSEVLLYHLPICQYKSYNTSSHTALCVRPNVLFARIAACRCTRSALSHCTTSVLELGCHHDQGHFYYQFHREGPRATVLRAAGEWQSRTPPLRSAHPAHNNNLQTEDQQQGLVREIFSILSKRTDAVCNFVEGGRFVAASKMASETPPITLFAILQLKLLWQGYEAYLSTLCNPLLCICGG
jgi:hypothetical protein